MIMRGYWRVINGRGECSHGCIIYDVYSIEIFGLACSISIIEGEKLGFSKEFVD